jgi:hypothetical protein
VDSPRQSPPRLPEGIDPPPDRDSVLNGIDAEIFRLREQHRVLGWTNWALLAGISGILWALLGLLGSVHFSAATARLLLVVSIGLDALIATRGLLTREPSTAEQRFRPAAFAFARCRLHAVMSVVRAAALMSVARLLSRSWWTVSALAVGYFYGLQLLTNALVLATSYLDIPIGRGKGRAQRLGEVCSVSTIYLAAGLSLWFLSHASFADWRAGLLDDNNLRFVGLVVAAVYLVSLIALDSRDPVADALATTRRELAFGRIGVTTAIAQADIAISGARMSEALQSRIAAHLAMTEQIRVEIIDASLEFRGLRQAIEKVGPEPTRSDLDALRALRDAVMTSWEARAERTHALMNRTGVSMRRIAGHSALGPDDERKRIGESLEREEVTISRRLDDLREEVDKLLGFFKEPQPELRT